MKFKSYFLLILIALGLNSCNLDYFQDAEFGDFVWDGSLAIPLGELDYTVTELFEELDDGTAVIGPGEDGVVTIVYEEEIDAQSASDFLEIQDQTFNEEIRSNQTIDNSPIDITLSINETFEFSFTSQGDERIDSLYFRQGNFNLFVNSNIAHPSNFTLTVRSLIENNAVLVVQGSTGPFGTFQTEQSMADLTGLLHQNANGDPSPNTFVIEVDYEVQIPAGGSIAPSDNVAFEFQLRNAEYSDLFGYVGQQSLEFTAEDIEFGFFDIFSGGDLGFADPKVDFVFANGFGFPLGIDYSNVSATAKSGATINLSGSITDDFQVVNAPLIDGAEDVVETTHRLDNSNSNISEIFSSQPSAFRIEVASMPNPNNGPAQYNFINELQEIAANVVIEIPLDISMDDLVANEGFDFKNAEDLDQAKRALMRVNATNEMPMGGILEIQFLDENGDIIYTIDERPVFEAAEVGPDGRTIGAAETVSEVLLEDADLRQIEGAARVNIRARLSSTDVEQGASVKLFEDYVLNLKVALQADVELTTSGN